MRVGAQRWRSDRNQSRYRAGGEAKNDTVGRSDPSPSRRKQIEFVLEARRHRATSKGQSTEMAGPPVDFRFLAGAGVQSLDFKAGDVISRKATRHGNCSSSKAARSKFASAIVSSKPC